MVLLDLLAAQLEDISDDLASQLAKSFDDKDGFSSREFYGTAFAIWLWSMKEGQFDLPRNRALNFLNENFLNSDPSIRHWEFLRFALGAAQHIGGLSPYSDWRDVLGASRFKGTRVANWTLLRSTVRIRDGAQFSKMVGAFEREIALLLCMKPDGFIEDGPQDRSLQYHAFCSFLLGYQASLPQGKGDRVLRQFERSLLALARLVLPSGDSNYFGRGQKQIFGYAASIAAFSVGYKIFGEPQLLDKASDTLDFLLDHGLVGRRMSLLATDQTDLVLGPVDTSDPIYAGWYSYNNYFDYVPFSAALLCYSAKVLNSARARLGTAKSQRLSNEVRVKDAPTASHIDNAWKFQASSFSGIVCLPGATPSDCQAQPFIELADGEQPFPCFGGEAVLPSLYKIEGLPLPTLSRSDGSLQAMFRPKSYQWMKPTQSRKCAFHSKGRDWSHTRMFELHPYGVTVTDEVELIRKLQPNEAIVCSRFFVKSSDQVSIQGPVLKGPNYKIVADFNWETERKSYWGPLGSMKVWCSPNEYGKKSVTHSFTLNLSADS